MPVSHVGTGAVAVQDTFGSTAIAVTAPAGAVGDLLLLAASSEAVGLDVNSISIASGWDKVEEAIRDEAGDTIVTLFRRIATGGALDSPTVTLTNSNSARAVIVRFSGHDPAAPVPAADDADATGLSLLIPQIASPRAGSMQFVCASNWGGTGNTLSFNWPAGFTTATSVGNNSITVGWRAINVGSTPAESITIGQSGRLVIVNAVIQPPGDATAAVFVHHYRQQGVM